MSMENKTNLVMAVHAYKSVKKEKTANFTDVSALDNLNKKVLLRIIEPIANEYVSINDVKNMTELVAREGYDQAVLISKKFTDSALKEMGKQKIQYVSDDYMPPFAIEELYLAIVNCANNQCQKRCSKALAVISDCNERKIPGLCNIKILSDSAKGHFEQGSVGLLKNDLKVALALNR